MDRCFDAGYTMYTIDPSDHVDNEADHLDTGALEERFRALPGPLGTTPDASLQRYTEDVHAVGGSDVEVSFSEDDFKCAAVKYGAALAHTKAMASYVAARYRTGRPGEEYDLEMSVDETDHPLTHPRGRFYVALELERLGVAVTSLAPRFTGDFEEGIDFKGDLRAFEESFRKHATIARAFGGYKLSIHSGSDKFSVFPLMGKYAADRLHLKTADTSYLEALRIVARHAPGLFREIVRFAFERFEADRKTYHVSTDLDAIPLPKEVADEDLELIYLDDNDGRQLLHITYGSVLSEKDASGALRFRTRFFGALNAQEEEHYGTLKVHFTRHIESVGGGFAGDTAV